MKMFSKIKILITGSNGYIGSHLAKKMISNGYDISLTDIQEKSVLNYTKYFKLDFTEPNLINKRVEGFDYIFFLTGRTGPAQDSFENPNEFILGNEITLLNLLKSIKNNNKKPKIIFPSTRLLYAGSKYSFIDENSEIEPKTVYAVNKIACENYLDLYQRCFGIDYSVFRISLPYGSFFEPNSNSHGVMSFLIKNAIKGNGLKIFGTGSQKGTFIHIEDLVNILIEASLNSKTNNGIFNIGGKNNLTMKEVILAIAEKYKVNAENVPWPEVSLFAEHGDIVFNSDKLNNIIEYSCKHDFFKWLKKI
jgi:UDP-glucose 4-epimerase